MSERSIHKRIPGTREKSRPPNPSPLPRRRRTPTPTPRRSKPLSKPIRNLQRCKSEPILWTVGPVYGNETQGPRFDFILLRPKTCTDVFTSPIMSPSSNSNFEKLKKDAKVVVNVTVEGSPGPVRTLVRLGASVEETIKLVVDKYSDEGRSPHLNREAAPTEFELHHSHFSLESIKKTETIGDIGSRSFYLRKGSSGHRSRSSSTTDDDNEAGTQKLAISFSAPEIVPCSSNTSSSNSKTITTANAQESSSPLLVFLPEFIVRKIAKLGRRTRKIWNVLGCL